MNKHLNILRWVAASTLLLYALVSFLAAQSLPAPTQPFAPLPAAVPLAPAAPPVDAMAAGKPIQPPHQKAALIRLHGEVDDMMLSSLQRRVDIARKAGCTLIVYEMDTGGGMLFSGLSISKYTKTLPNDHLATVAWVNDKAYSAGALISVACQQVVMSSESSIGLCAPIALEGHSLKVLPAAERAKLVGYLFEELEDSARKNGYNELLLKAMVDPDIEVHEMHGDHGEVTFVDTPGKDKLLAQEVVAPDGTKYHPWHFVSTFEPLLTVRPEKALAMKLASARVDNEEQLRATLNIQGDLLILDFSWAEIATVFLSQMWVRVMLFTLMLVLAYLEFAHPGVTIPGVGALICLLLIIAPAFLTGLAQVWEIALIVLGLAIIVLDLVVFGGIGLLAIPGFLLMILGIIASFVPREPGGGFIPTMQSTWDALAWGSSSIAGSLVLAIIIFYFLSKYLRMTPGFRRIQLAPAGGAAPTMTTPVMDSAERSASDAVFIGAIGRAATQLHPAGKARFGEFLVDVVTNGDFIEGGEDIEVIEVSSWRIVVRAHKTPAPQNPATGETP